MIYFLFVLLLSFNIHADEERCWQNEINPATKRTYTSAAVWQAELDRWKTKEPKAPSLDQLFRAYEIYKNEKSAAQKLKNDKVKHCYIGCRIAQELNPQSAEYVGWYKEAQDLEDCERNTRFEEKDYEATLFGANLQVTGQEACVSSCRETWQNQRRRR